MRSIPESAAYRINVEKITKHRLKIVEEEQSIESIEKRLGIGQVQEVIEQAQDELDLIPHMIEWQPWNVPPGKTPVKIEVTD